MSSGLDHGVSPVVWVNGSYIPKHLQVGLVEEVGVTSSQGWATR